MLSDRLPDITPKVRAEVSPAMNKIIVSIRDIIAKQKDDRVLIFSFRALKSIASTLCPADEGPLAGVVQGTLAAVKDQLLAPSALSALASMSFVVSLICFYISKSFYIGPSLDLGLFLSFEPLLRNAL